MSAPPDTAAWTAACRATAPGLDPWAAQFSFGANPPPPPIPNVIESVIRRTHVMDGLILRVLGKHRISTVLNLGCGYDTRPWRLRIPSCVTLWIDADSPSVLERKRQVMNSVPSRCPVLYRPVRIDSQKDEYEHAGMERLLEKASVSPNLLVITEGLLVYMTTQQVSMLTAQFSAQLPPRCWWITDLVPHPALALMNAKADGRPFRFAPREGPEFFSALGWSIASRHPVVRHSPATPLPPRFRLSSSLEIVLFENTLARQAPAACIA